MATLKSNGAVICEMTITTVNNNEDGCKETRITVFRAMESGKTLKNTTVIQALDGMPESVFHTGWKVAGRIKKYLKTHQDIRAAMHEWQEDLIAQGIDAEITQ